MQKNVDSQPSYACGVQGYRHRDRISPRRDPRNHTARSGLAQSRILLKTQRHGWRMLGPLVNGLRRGDKLESIVYAPAEDGERALRNGLSLGKRDLIKDVWHVTCIPRR